MGRFGQRTALPAHGCPAPHGLARSLQLLFGQSWFGRGRSGTDVWRLRFDEMNGSDGALRPAYGGACRAGSTKLPPDVLDYRRREAELMFRRIGITFAVYGEADAHGAADPVRRAAAHPRRRRMGRAAPRPRTARQGAQRSTSATSTAARDILRAGIVPEDLVFQNPVFRPEMNGQKVAARHLRAYRRHRHRARRCRDVLRARRQCPHAVRRLLHAGEPRDHAAAVPGAVRAPPGRAGRELSRRTAGDAAIGRAAEPARPIRPSCC